jgi:hypothetical protein
MDLPELTPELIGSGLVGLVMSGIVARGAIMGFIDARSKMREHEKLGAGNPFTSVAGALWDRDQMERLMQLLERIGEALEMQSRYTEMIAKSQSILSDSYQQSTQSKLNDLLEMLEKAESRPKPRPRARRKPKSSS